MSRTRRALLAGTAGVAGAGMVAPPAAAAGWSPRRLQARYIEVGDILVGPEGGVVRIGEVTKLSTGRIRLRATSPYFGDDELVRFPGDLDREGFSTRRLFIVLQRNTPLVVLRYPEPAESADEPMAIPGVFGWFFPEQYGAVGDGVADDTKAVQSAIDAAFAAGGGHVLLSRRYGWTGDLHHKGTVTVSGVGTRRSSTSPPDPNTGLVALDSSARYRYGLWDAQSRHNNPGPLQNLVIDGNDVGGASELLLMNCVDGALVGVHLVNGVGNGIEVAGSQNSTIDRCFIGYFGDGVALEFHNPEHQGAGSVKVDNCYVTDSRLLFGSDSAPDHFPPHDCILTSTLFEQRLQGRDLVQLRAGEFQFHSCVFTYSLDTDAPTADTLFLVDNPTKTGWPTTATIDSCYFNGGNGTGVPSVIRLAQAGDAPNEVCLYGRNSVRNQGRDNSALLGLDASSGRATISGSVSRGRGVHMIAPVNGGNTGNVRIDDATRVPVRTHISADRSVQIDAANESARELVLANAVSVGIEITAPFGGANLRIGVAASTGNSVTWPEEAKFAGGTPPDLVDNRWNFVDFTYASGHWLETSRSLGVPRI